MHPRRVAPLLTIVALALVACGGGGGGGGGSFGSGDDFSVAAAFAEVPAFDETAGPMFSTADVIAAGEANRAERPDDAASDDVIPWMMRLTAAALQHDPAVFVAPPAHLMQTAAQMGEFEDVTGFSFVDADAFVTAALPPEDFTVFTGEGLDDDVLADDLVEVSDGVVSTTDGEDLAQDLAGDRTVDQLGRPVRFAQADGRVAMSLVTPFVEDWLAGDEETLADDESLAAVAAALDDADVVSASVFAVDPGAGPAVPPDATPEMIEKMGLDDLPAAYAAVGLGWAADGTITVVYDYVDASAAEDALPRLQEVYEDGTSLTTQVPIADLVALEEIASDDRLVIATVAPGPEGHLRTVYDMVIRRDLPFVG